MQKGTVREALIFIYLFKDIDECNAHPCKNKNDTKCVNTVGGFACLCKTGFYNDSGSCVGE